jgi:hypothetical protein
MPLKAYRVGYIFQKGLQKTNMPCNFSVVTYPSGSGVSVKRRKK